MKDLADKDFAGFVASAQYKAYMEELNNTLGILFSLLLPPLSFHHNST